MEQNYMEKDYIEEVFEDLFFNSIANNNKLFNNEEYKRTSKEYTLLYKKIEKELSPENKSLLDAIYDKRMELSVYENKFTYRQAFKDSLEILKKLKFI